MCDEQIPDSVIAQYQQKVAARIAKTGPGPKTLDDCILMHVKWMERRVIPKFGFDGYVLGLLNVCPHQVTSNAADTSAVLKRAETVNVVVVDIPHQRPREVPERKVMVSLLKAVEKGSGSTARGNLVESCGWTPLGVKESWASGGRPRITEKSMSKEVLLLVIPVIPILSDMLANDGVQQNEYAKQLGQYFYEIATKANLKMPHGDVRKLVGLAVAVGVTRRGQDVLLHLDRMNSSGKMSCLSFSGADEKGWYRVAIFLYPRVVIERYIEYVKFKEADSELSRGSAAQLLNAVEHVLERSYPPETEGDEYFHATDSKLDCVTALLTPIIGSKGVASWGPQGKLVAVLVASLLSSPDVAMALAIAFPDRSEYDGIEGTDTQRAAVLLVDAIRFVSKAMRADWAGSGNKGVWSDATSVVTHRTGAFQGYLQILRRKLQGHGLGGAETGDAEADAEARSSEIRAATKVIKALHLAVCTLRKDVCGPSGPEPNGFAKQRSKARKGIADFGKWLKKAKLGFGNLQFPVFVVGLQFVKIMKFNAGALDVVCRGEFMKLGGGSAERLKAAGLSEQQLNDWVDEFSGGWVSKWVKENVVCEGKRFENGKVVLVPNFGLGFIVEHYDVNGRGSLQLDVAQRVFESFSDAADKWQSKVSARAYVPSFYENDDTDDEAMDTDVDTCDEVTETDDEASDTDDAHVQEPKKKQRAVETDVFGLE